MVGSQTSPFMLDVSDMVDSAIEASIFRAVVTAIGTDSVRIIRTGQTAEDDQDYAAVDIYPFPLVGDEVLVLKLGKGYVVVGHIVRGGLTTLHQTLILGAGSVASNVVKIKRDGFDATTVIRSGISGVAGVHEAVQTNYTAYEDETAVNKYEAFLNLSAGDAFGLGSTTVLTLGIGIPYPIGAPITTLFTGFYMKPSLHNPQYGYIEIGDSLGANISFNRGDVEDANSGQGTLHIGNAITPPTGNPAGGGFLWAEGGAGKWRSSGGTTTTFGTADPHCPDCGRDFALEWENEAYGHLVLCMWCFTEGLTRGIIRRDA